MASYAALTSLLQTLEQIPQPHRQITYLQCRCELLRRVLLIVDDSPLRSSSPVKVLEWRIADASYEADDIIQSQISRQVLSKSLTRSRFSSFFRKMIRSEEYMPRHVSLEFQGLEKVIHEFDSILDDLSDKIKDGRATNSLTGASSRSPASDKNTVVGLDEDLLHLKDRLTGSPSKLDIISIVGMGGIGKTTLARNLYNDSLVQEHFHTRAWIVVSQEYHLREMFTGLLDSTRHGGDQLHKKKIQELAELLYKSLKGRRYLIVMDDVWDTQVWDDVRRFFPDDNNGSRIVLTTRLSEVATYAISFSSIHYLSLLSSEESWNLLREKLFGKESCPLELEEIGKKIANNCKGLPLAIIVISGLLGKGSKTQEYWQYIAENVKSAVTENNDEFMEILSLSYNSLPLHLKPCFLYMGGFPEDYGIVVSKLIKLWIAEGFVQREVHKSLEEVAKEHLKDLIDRSLVMVQRQNDRDGKMKTCIVIHDMWRELCLKKAREENFLQILNSDISHFPQGENNQRRVSIHADFLKDNIPHVHDSRVRSLLYFGDFRCISSSVSSKILSIITSCRLLLVLDAITIRFYKFPIQILELVHLRYLAFLYKSKSKSKSKRKFPASISKLQNLQTLIVHRDMVSFSDKIFYLPSSMWEMLQLRHLCVEKNFFPAPITRKDSSVLENLQTLSGVTNFRCTRKVVEMMPNLKKLGISYFPNADTNWSLYEFDNFVKLHQLERMRCELFGWPSRPSSLPIFSFPPNLKKLTLIGWQLPWEKMTVIGSLPNLEVLKLKYHAFKGSIWEPNDGEFNKLKFLHIESSNLEHWRANDTHFPCLQHLKLVKCTQLVEIPSEIGEIPTLEMLELYECSPSAEESAKVIQEEQQSLENNTLRVVLLGGRRAWGTTAE